MYVEQIKEDILNILSKCKRKGMNELIDWLTKTDYFTAPASTKYHLAFEGGLAMHSLNVYNALQYKYETAKDTDFNLPDIDEESLAIVALLHDVCKIETYTIEPKWTKEDGKWVQVDAYVYKTALPLGHGSKSVIVLQQFIELTREEQLAIFWHMNAFDISPYMTLDGLSQAKRECLLLNLLIEADEFATYIMENELYQ